jgi:hypothetical protein
VTSDARDYGGPVRPFNAVDLSELRDAGVLMAANEQFFWPLGLALTWLEPAGGGPPTDLHVRQWDPPEVIELDPADPIGDKRRQAFQRWMLERLRTLIR